MEVDSPLAIPPPLGLLPVVTLWTDIRREELVFWLMGVGAKLLMPRQATLTSFLFDSCFQPCLSSGIAIHTSFYFVSGTGGDYRRGLAVHPSAIGTCCVFFFM